jgi:ABC-type protease/lipase transport system fused ATPase/permease subunit
MGKISLTPGKTISAGSIGILIIFLLFGIGFAVLVVNVMSENDAPPLFKLLIFLVVIIFIGTVLFMLVYHARNLSSEKGMSLIDINMESDTKDESKGSPVQSLRDLEQLKNEGLITETEYQQKRSVILERIGKA